MMPAQQARARGAIRRTSLGANAQGSSSGVVLPFDHAATFELKGIPGNIIQDVINISTEGIFVAVAIGYGFEEDRAQPAPLNPAPTTSFLPGSVLLSQIPTAALIEGFRLNPEFERFIFEAPAPNAGRQSVRERRFSAVPRDPSFGASIIERLKPAEEISFLFSIVDSGSGRELQDEPIHNLASLGKSNGERPFRQLAQPLTFQPRSTIRLQIVERSEGIRGTLFIVLYGYKILGGGASPEAAMRGINASPAFPAGPIEQPSDRIIPFDYVSKFQLTGSPGNQLEDEVPINVEGGFIATSIGYGLGVESLGVTVSQDNLTITRPTTPPGPPTIPLGSVPLANFPTGALQDGIRIRPNFLRIAFTNGGQLDPNFPVDSLDRVFERLNRPQDVSFRYSIADTGTGRDLQNQPLNNIAGLGIADGDRPFKKFARPMLFLPRSTIRVSIEELFGRGTLFIVFQGYKILGGSAPSAMPARGRRARRR
jgi:hypothetical protein